MAFANTINMQFVDLRTGRSKRQFALSVRFWADMCYWLLLAAFVADGVATFLIGSTYYPSSCGSAQDTREALREVNATLDSPGSPCVSIHAEEISIIAGALVCAAIVTSFVATLVRMRPTKFACHSDAMRGRKVRRAGRWRYSGAPQPRRQPAISLFGETPSPPLGSRAWRRICCGQASTLGDDADAARAAAAVTTPRRAGMSAGDVEHVGRVIVNQCMFFGVFSRMGIIRFMPLGLRNDPDQELALPVGLTCV